MKWINRKNSAYSIMVRMLRVKIEKIKSSVRKGITDTDRVKI